MCKSGIIDVWIFDGPVTCPVCGTRCDENGEKEGQAQCPCGNAFDFEILDDTDPYEECMEECNEYGDYGENA